MNENIDNYKTVNDSKLVDKMNSFIRKITFFKNYTIFVDKKWLSENDLLLFPLFLDYDEEVLDLFNKANKHKKYYISGIDSERETHRELKPIDNYTDTFLLPDFIYEVEEGKSFELGFMQAPEYFLVINSEFNLGIIYDSDLWEYYIFGKKEDIEVIFGNFDKFIINNQLEKEMIFYRHKYYNNNNYSERMTYLKEYYLYYESILQENSYLNETNQKKAELRLLDITSKLNTVFNSKSNTKPIQYSKFINSLTGLVEKMIIEYDYSFLPKKEWIIDNDLFAFSIFKKKGKKLLKLFNIANNYEVFYILGINFDADIIEVKNYTPSSSFIYENVDFSTYLYLMKAARYYLVINSEFNFGLIYTSRLEMYYIFGKKENIESMFGDIKPFIETNYLEKKSYLNSLDYKFNYEKEFDYYNSILKEQGYLDFI